MYGQLSGIVMHGYEAINAGTTLLAFGVGMLCIGSYFVLKLLQQAGTSMLPRARWALVACAACVFGDGCWTLHFCTLLASSGDMPVQYDLLETITSAILCMFGAFAAFSLLVVARMSKSRTFQRLGALVSALVLSIAVEGAHRLGSEGIRVPGHIETLTSASMIAIAVGALGFMLAFNQSFSKVTWSWKSIGRGEILAAFIATTTLFFIHMIMLAGTHLLPGNMHVTLDTDLTRPAIVILTGGAMVQMLSLSCMALFVDTYIVRRDLQQRSQMGQFVRAAFEGLLIVRGREMLDVNERFGGLLGYTAAELVGRDPTPLFAPEHLHLVAPQIHNLPEDQARDLRLERSVDLHLIHKDGRRIPVEVMTKHIRVSEQHAVVFAVRDLTERTKSADIIHHLAHHDGLTDLPNRRMFHVRCGEALESAAAMGHQSAVLCLDLDGFKAVNDTMGHDAGDQLLVQVSQRILGVVSSPCTAARLGGDEFAVILPILHDAALAENIAGQLVQRMHAPFSIMGQVVNIGVSIGIALYPTDASSEAVLLKHADIALYRAKNEGRGIFCRFDQKMNQELLDRRQMELDLRAAMERDIHQLSLCYQPLVECSTGEVTGFEALARWTHPTRGSVPSAVFVALAEECGLIVALGRWVIETALREAVQWEHPYTLAINLSSTQFRSPGLVDSVASALAMSGLPAQRLEMEITENVLLDQSEHTMKALKGLKGLGVRIALDDFGTGYSSLSYLRKFAFDKIKIDRSFIQDIDSPIEADATESRAIVGAIIAMAHSLNMSITAEGVETEAQLDVLRFHRCHVVQGFLLGHPIPASDISSLPSRLGPRSGVPLPDRRTA